MVKLGWTVALTAALLSAASLGRAAATQPVARSGDWPGFRGGLDRSAVSSETGLARCR
jgi:hypothetical protein